MEMPGSSVKAGQTLSPQKALNKLEKKRVYTRLEERKHDRKRKVRWQMRLKQRERKKEMESVIVGQGLFHINLDIPSYFWIYMLNFH